MVSSTSKSRREKDDYASMEMRELFLSDTKNPQKRTDEASTRVAMQTPDTSFPVTEGGVGVKHVAQGSK